MSKKKNNNKFIWYCNVPECKYSYFQKETNRKRFKTEEEAEASAELHCDLKDHGVMVCEEK